MYIKPKLDFQEFIDEIIIKIKNQIDEECLIERHRVLKNNSVALEGIMIRKEGGNLAPTIYLESYYSNYLSDIPLSDIAKSIIKVYNDSITHNQFLDRFSLDYKDIKEKIIYRVISYNKNIQLLETIPHEKLIDLAVVYYCVIDQEEDTLKSVIISNEILDKWSITYQELKQNSKINTERLFPSIINEMNAVLEEASMDIKNGSAFQSMYILTNKQGINGASCILYNEVLHSFYLSINKDFYILPSSIHELILLPADKSYDIEELSNMVREINESQVADEEVLSDNAYLYSEIAAFINSYND